MKALFLRIFLWIVIIGFCAFSAFITFFYFFGKDLPGYSQLESYEPPVLSRFYSYDGRLLAEHATEKRIFIPLSFIPKRIIRTFLAVEDKNFYEHHGIDFFSIARAFVKNIGNIVSGKRPEGASTITQQVAKNFLLTNELSYIRKVKEAILSLRIEHTFPKEKILELYLNEIYLGMGTYGIAAASLHYFNKSLDELSIAEAAYLAALPKAPSNYNPEKNPEAAKSRRDWVLNRMLEEKIASVEEVELAKKEPIKFFKKAEETVVRADYFGEEVRRELIQTFGESALYKGGLIVQTTLDTRLQKIADKTLTEGLIAYDRRHGWRGPLQKLQVDIKNKAAWVEHLKSVKEPAGSDNGVKTYELAIVLELSPDKTTIGLKNGSLGFIPTKKISWARRVSKAGIGPVPTDPKMIFELGDVILVEKEKDQNYVLAQIPKVSGAIIAMNPHTGRILAMTGGYSFEISQFNRATQAQRQPGSAFKTFVYLAGLEQGLEPNLIIPDAPITIELGNKQQPWSPKNYTKDYYGPITLRHALENSRNTVTVRIAQKIGMKSISEIANRFGIQERMPLHMAMILGTGETTPLKLTTAYAQIANGGKQIEPTCVEWVQDRRGKIIWRYDKRRYDAQKILDFNDAPMPDLEDNRKQIADPVNIYQITSILEGVIQRGTGRAVGQLGVPVAGKTGTSQDSRDAWFMGFTPDLVVGVFVGFDKPRDMGRIETGAYICAPMFLSFMKEALKDYLGIPFRIPKDVKLKRIDFKTGQPPTPQSKTIIWEAFKNEAQAEKKETIELKGMGDLY